MEKKAPCIPSLCLNFLYINLTKMSKEHGLNDLDGYLWNQIFNDKYYGINF